MSSRLLVPKFSVLCCRGDLSRRSPEGEVGSLGEDRLLCSAYFTFAMVTVIYKYFLPP
jgi:hypothetical protein